MTTPRPCHNAHPHCPGPEDCERPRTACCHGRVTSAHPQARGCYACHAGQSPAAMREAERQAARPTVGRPARPTRGALGLPALPERERRSGATPEALVLAEVRRALDGCSDLAWWRNSTGLARTAGGGRLAFGAGSGSADILGVVSPHGRLVAIEVKSADGRVAPAQHAWLARMAAMGAAVGVARSAAEALAVVERARGRT